MRQVGSTAIFSKKAKGKEDLKDGRVHFIVRDGERERESRGMRSEVALPGWEMNCPYKVQ